MLAGVVLPDTVLTCAHLPRGRRLLTHSIFHGVWRMQKLPPCAILDATLSCASSGATTTTESQAWGRRTSRRHLRI